jgi:hypothetical protein
LSTVLQHLARIYQALWLYCNYFPSEQIYYFYPCQVGFLMLASGAVLTNGFRHANTLQLTLITAGCVISVAALAGAISALLLLILAALLLGFLARMFLGR